jgi:broad specificity phosphatase PhoE
MISLVLVCCGATSANRRGAFPADEPLDVRGAAAAAAAAGMFAKTRHAITSPALRARQTANALGINAEVEDSLREVDYGTWAGTTLRELESRDLPGVTAWLTDPESAPHGGESIAALFARTRDFLQAQIAETGSLVAVTHTSFVRAAVTAALNAPMSTFWQIDIGPLTRTTLHGDGARWRLRSIVNA